MAGEPITNQPSSNQAAAATSNVQQSNKTLSPWEEDLPQPQNQAPSAPIPQGAFNGTTIANDIRQFALPPEAAINSGSPAQLVNSGGQVAQPPAAPVGKANTPNSQVFVANQVAPPVQPFPVAAPVISAIPPVTTVPMQVATPAPQVVNPSQIPNQVAPISPPFSSPVSQGGAVSTGVFPSANALTSAAPQILGKTTGISKDVVSPAQISGQGAPVQTQPPVGMGMNEAIKPSLLKKLFRGRGDNVNNQVDVAKQGTRRNAMRLIKKIVGVLAVIVIMLSLVVFLNERGLISFGAEKIYGKVGLERLWGGLPEDTQSAIGRSFVSMSDENAWEVTGKISMIVDRSTNSPLIAPLVTGSGSETLDVSALKIILASVDDETEIDWNDPSESFTDSTIEETEDASASDTTTSPPTAASSTPALDSTELSTLAPESAASTDTEVPGFGDPDSDFLASTITADITGNFTRLGSETKLQLLEPRGEINLKSKEGELWVKSPDYTFAGKKSLEKWIPITPSSLGGEDIVNVFFDINPKENIKIDGRRVGNEKIEGERAYKYDIKSASLGSALAKFGIQEGEIESISGSVWIGVARKQIRKMELQIVPIGLAASQVTLNISIKKSSLNEVAMPADDDIFTSDDLLVSSDTVAAPITDEKAARDVKRRADLTQIADALAKYKTAKKNYIISKNALNLGTAKNAVEKALVPTYIQSLPKEEKFTEGYAYIYQSSDGKSFTLRAQLEVSEDPEGKKEGEKNLYIVTGQ
ncbi:MAG TPA: hypothetical protein PK263_01200 [bacterium]|nr:hypothetical protein [bacterium]